MNPTEFAAVASAIAWPLTLAAFIVTFYNPIRALLVRLSATLAIKTVNLTVFGANVVLTPEQARHALDELLQDIAESTNELTADEIALFKRIVRSSGREIVREVEPTFAFENPAHLRLRNLRDRKLVRPFEGGRWKADKHPIATRFGQLVHSLQSSPKTVEAEVLR
jgi:hypothetical protein